VIIWGFGLACVHFSRLIRPRLGKVESVLQTQQWLPSSPPAKPASGHTKPLPIGMAVWRRGALPAPCPCSRSMFDAPFPRVFLGYFPVVTVFQWCNVCLEAINCASSSHYVPTDLPCIRLLPPRGAWYQFIGTFCVRHCRLRLSTSPWAPQQKSTPMSSVCRVSGQKLGE
jgi:hypothetical protein